MIRWITEELGTGAWERVPRNGEYAVVDVRDLLDGPGNALAAIRAKIEEGLRHLREGRRVVVCCHMGMSRSNAVAAGVLGAREELSFSEALQRVVRATGENAIRLEVLSAVRLACEEDGARAQRETGAQRCLLTGATGYIGSTLRAGAPLPFALTAPPRAALDLERDALGLDMLVKDEGIDTLLHLAHPRVFTTNTAMGSALVMLKNVLDVCVANQLALVYLSGTEVFSGYQTTGLRADESLPPFPGSTAGHIKVLCEELIGQYRRRHGLRVTLLRAGAVYGPGSDRPKVIHDTIRKARAGEEIVTHRYANGLPALDLLHVVDLRAALAAAVERRPEGTFHLGTGVLTTTAAVAEQIVALLGSESRIRTLELAGSTSNIALESGRATAALGWRAQIPLAEGLRTLLDAVEEAEAPAALAATTHENL